jgi:two-component system, NtrC family, nitrogen regulation sensor histidine kinase NtrY
MDSAADRLAGSIFLLAPGPDAVLLLRSAKGIEFAGTLTPELPDALAEATRTGRSQPARLRDCDGGERELRVFPAPGLPGQALAVAAELEQCILATAVETLVNQIAHDVRNHAFTIGLQAEMGSRRAGETSELKGYFDAVLRHVDSLKHYLEQLLLFGRVPTLSPARLDPVLLVRDLLHRYQFARPADAPPLSVRLEAEPHPGTVSWDVRAVTAALAAVLDNAVRSADPPPPVTIRLARCGDRVAVEVRDSGGGIGSEALARLAVPMAVRRAGGAGLGLAIARKLVSAHGGRLTIESLETGTVVRLDLPTEAGAA